MMMFENPLKKSKITRSRTLSETELQAFAAELDALRQSVLANIGEEDARYIRRIVKSVRISSAWS